MKFFYNSFIRLYTKELVAIRLQELRGDYSLLKGRSVKYIRRIPTGQPKRPYIYIYASDSPEKRRAKLQYAKDLNQKRKPKDEKRQSTIFDTIANKIKSIFPSADPKKDFSDYEVNGGTLSKEEYAKIALDYFQNKEKYDKVAIKVKKEAGQEKPKVKRESKELTEEEIALKDKQKQRRLIIKQLKAKYGSTGVPTEMNIATIPEGKVGDYKTMPEGTIAYDQMKAEEEREVKEEIGEIPVENPSVGQPKEIKNKDHYKNKLKDVSLQRLNELEKFYENDFNSENIIGAIREIRQEKFPGTRADQIKEQKFSIPKNKKYSKNGEIYFTSEQVEQYKPEKEVKEIVSNGVSLGWSVNNLGKIPAQSGVRYYDEKEQAVNVARNLKQKVVDYIRDKDIHNFTETDSKGQPARTSGQASPTKDVKSDVVNVENKNQSSAPKETKVEVKQDKPINTETESGIEKQTFSNEEVKKISSQALRDIAKDNRPKVRMVINGIFTIAYKANISLKRVKKQLDELIQTAGGIPDDVAKTIVKTITGKELKSPQDLSTALKSFVESAYNTAWEKYRNTDVVKTNPKMFRDKREGEEKEVKEPIFNKSSFFLRKIQKGLKGSTGRNVKYKQRIPTGHKKTPYIYIYEDDTQDVVKRKKEQADALKREVKGKPLKQEKVQANNTQAENKKTVTKKIQIQVDPKKSIPDVVKELQVGDIVTMKNGIKFELLSSDSKGVKRKITFKDGSEEIRYTETKNIASIQGWVIDRSITETIIEEKQPEVEKPKKKDIKPEVVEQDSKPKEEPPKNNFKTMPESKTTETPKPGGDGTSTLFGAESMPQSAWEQSEMFSDKQKFDATRKDFKPTIVLQTTNIDELTSSVKNALLKEGKTKDAKEFVDSTYKAGQGIEEVLTIASNYVNVQKPFSDSEISYKSIKAKIQLAKFDKDLTDTKRQYIDYQEEYLKHLEKSKKVFKDSKEISMYLLKEYDNYTGKGKTSDGFENTNFKKSTLQPPTKTAYRKEGDIKTQTNTGTVSDQANKQSVGQSKQIAVEKLKIKDQYTKKEHFDRPVIEGIKKSILENGFNPAFPITVDQDGYVVDGHHRASAVMELLEEGKVNKDFPVSIIQKNYTSEADRLLDQLSANEMRREVLILDKAKAYATLLKQGKTAEEIGARNNKSPADIKSIASLENLVPEIKQIITAEFMRDRKGKKPTGTVEEQETESFSIPVGVAVAIAKNGLNDDGTPNGTLQRKALNWFRENRQKGARGTQVASYIRELKEAQSGGFFTQEESTSASQRESMDIIGSEEKAKRNISSLQRMQTNIQKELTKIAGDNIQDVNKKVLKEIAASVIAIKGSADLMLAGLKTTLRDFELLIYGIEKASKEIESDAQTPTMFGKSKYSSYKFKPESKETILKLKKALIKLRLQALRLERSLELYE